MNREEENERTRGDALRPVGLPEGARVTAFTRSNHLRSESIQIEEQRLFKCVLHEYLGEILSRRLGPKWTLPLDLAGVQFDREGDLSDSACHALLESTLVGVTASYRGQVYAVEPTSIDDHTCVIVPDVERCKHVKSIGFRIALIHPRDRLRRVLDLAEVCDRAVARGVRIPAAGVPADLISNPIYIGLTWTNEW